MQLFYSKASSTSATERKSDKDLERSGKGFADMAWPGIGLPGMKGSLGQSCLGFGNSFSSSYKQLSSGAVLRVVLACACTRGT